MIDGGTGGVSPAAQLDIIDAANYLKPRMQKVVYLAAGSNDNMTLAASIATRDFLAMELPSQANDSQLMALARGCVEQICGGCDIDLTIIVDLGGNVGR